MAVTITTRGLQIADSLKSFIEDRIEKAVRYLDQVMDVTVVLTSEKYRCNAEVIVHAKGHTFTAEHETGDPRASFEGAADKLEKQIRRYKDKLTERNRRSRDRAVRDNLLPGEDGDFASDEPRIIRTDNFVVKPMSVDEAALQMGAGDEDFVVFRNSNTNEVNVLYQRRDGNYGLIEPEA